MKRSHDDESEFSDYQPVASSSSFWGWTVDVSRFARAQQDDELTAIREERRIQIMLLEVQWGMAKPVLSLMPPEADTGCPYDQPSVPVFSLYGLTPKGMSIRANVYGYFPFVHLRCEPIFKTAEWLEEVRAILDELMAEHDRTTFPFLRDATTLKRVLNVTVENVYPIGEYEEFPVEMLRVSLATPKYVNIMQTLFEAKPGVERATLNTSYGSVSVAAYTCLEALFQFGMETEIVGFGWVQLDDCEFAYNNNRTRARTTCEVNAAYSFLHALPEKRDLSADIRVMTYDIEIANVAGFPVAGNSPIINIAVRNSTGDGKVTGDVLFQLGMSDPVTELDSVPNGIHYMFGRNGVIKREKGQLDPPDEAALLTNTHLGQPEEVQQIEAAMLTAFGDFVQAYDPDIIVGHNSNGFDNPYVLDRAHVLMVENAESLGRDHAHWQENKKVEKMRKNGESSSSLRATIVGRVQADTMLIFKSDTTKKEPSFKLGALAQKYLKDKNKEAENKDDVGYTMIVDLSRRSNYTRQRLAKYNKKDVFLTFRLFDEFKMLFDMVEMTRATRLMPQMLINRGQSAKVWAQVLHATKNPGWSAQGYRAVIPYETPAPRAADDKFKGATVLEPIIGFYDKLAVMVGDFRSLYPSLIIFFNACFSSLLRRSLESVHLTPADVETSSMGATFVKSTVRKGILPILCEHLLAARDAAKEDMKKAKLAGNELGEKLANSRQLALKICANSVYGFTGASGGAFVRMAISASVTAWGRCMIDLAKKTAEGVGCNVIYGDTDSIMWTHPEVGNDLAKAFVKLKAVCDTVTKKINHPAMLLQPEKVYYPWLLLCKKHYAGYIYMAPPAPPSAGKPPEEPKVDQKGIETARRDYCKFVTNTLDKVLHTLMRTRDTQAAVAVAVESVRKLLSGQVDIVDLNITRSLSRATYKVNQPHADLMDRIEKRTPGFKRQIGDRILYVIINQPNGTNKTCQKSEDPLRVIREKLPIDYDYYLHTQLEKPLLRLMVPLLGGEKRARAQLFGMDALHGTVRAQAKASETSGIGKYFKASRVCSSCKMTLNAPKGDSFCKACVASGKAETKTRELKQQCHDIEESLEKWRQKCIKCRGYDDSSVECQQKDCRTIYDVATAQEKLKDIKKVLDKNEK